MQTLLAFRDIKQGVSFWQLWTYLAFQDIKQRYRRSVIGPFWITINMAIMIGTVGTVYARLFHMDLQHYFPFLTAGIMLWSFVSTLISESCNVFVANESVIKQIKIPFSSYIYRLVYRNLLLLAHHFIVYIAVALLFHINPFKTAIFFVIAMVFFIINGIWIGFLLGLLCTRFRDTPQIITSLLQVLFLITPILWNKESLSSKHIFIEWNPLFHFMEIARQPLLGYVPHLTSWLIVLGFTFVGSLCSFWLFSLYRKRISFWL